MTVLIFTWHNFFTKINNCVLANQGFTVKECLWWTCMCTYTESWKGESCDRCRRVSASRMMSGWWELRSDQHLHRIQYFARSCPSLGIHPLVSLPHCGDVALSQCGRPLQHQPFVTIKYLNKTFIFLFYSCLLDNLLILNTFDKSLLL